MGLAPYFFIKNFQIGLEKLGEIGYNNHKYDYDYDYHNIKLCK
jgi:hypothetical protein